MQESTNGFRRTSLPRQSGGSAVGGCYYHVRSVPELARTYRLEGTQRAQQHRQDNEGDEGRTHKVIGEEASHPGEAKTKTRSKNSLSEVADGTTVAFAVTPLNERARAGKRRRPSRRS